MESLDELVKRLTSKGDVGAALLGFVLAYLLELRFALVAGLAPGTAGSLGAAAAVGLKNSIEALWNHSKPTTDLGRALEKAAHEIRRVDLDSMFMRVLEDLRVAVLVDHKLWSAGLITDDEFAYSIKQFVDPYRATQRGIIFRDLEAKRELAAKADKR